MLYEASEKGMGTQSVNHFKGQLGVPLAAYP